MSFKLPVWFVHENDFSLLRIIPKFVCPLIHIVIGVTLTNDDWLVLVRDTPLTIRPTNLGLGPGHRGGGSSDMIYLVKVQVVCTYVIRWMIADLYILPSSFD